MSAVLAIAFVIIIAIALGRFTGTLIRGPVPPEHQAGIHQRASD